MSVEVLARDLGAGGWERSPDGGGERGVNPFSTKEIRSRWLAKLSSSSTSSAISSGISRSEELWLPVPSGETSCRRGETSREWELERLHDCGETSRVCGTERAFRPSEDWVWREGRLIFVSDILFSEKERPRLLRSGTVGDEGEHMPKNILGDHGAFSDCGERD